MPRVPVFRRVLGATGAEAVEAKASLLRIGNRIVHANRKTAGSDAITPPGFSYIVLIVPIISQITGIYKQKVVINKIWPDVIGSLLVLPMKLRESTATYVSTGIPTIPAGEPIICRPTFVRDIEIFVPLGYIESRQCSRTELSLV
jgi:hypothetical protein